MMSTVLACLLIVIGGVSTIPQQSDVAPAQERALVELLFKRFIEQLSRGIRENGWDPKCIKGFEYEYESCNGLIKVEGALESMKITGLSNIVIENFHHNIWTGRLHFHICMPEIHISIDNYRTRGVVGDRGGELKVEGSLEVCNICIRGDAYLRLAPGTAKLTDLNVNFSVGSIKSNLEVIWKRLGCLIPRDISKYVNILINVTIPLYLNKFQNQINRILEVIISQMVNK